MYIHVPNRNTIASPYNKAEKKAIVSVYKGTTVVPL